MNFIRRYPIVVATVLTGALVAGLIAVGQTTAAQWVASIFALAVALHTGVGMVRDILHGRWGIDLLAVTAILSTVIIGEYLAALIIVLMLTGGGALEDYAAGRAQRELGALLQRVPQIAHREVDGGSTEDIPVGEVRVGDVLLVRPAEVLPVDGVLLSAAGAFDESALTGESLPVEHSAGDPLLSGSLNGEAAVRLRVSALVEDSQYSRIVALVQEAAASRAPVVRLADKYAVPFTGFSFALAAAAWALSADPARFAEVLVVATPCPLLIAAPVAFLGGMSRAAHAGIIVKNGGTLEQLGRIRTAAFDKTGTLTHGHPALQEIRISDARIAGAAELLQLAASAEQYSSHVMASSVVEAARARGLAMLPASDAREHATHGVTAVLAGRTVVVGKRAFVAESLAGSAPAVDKAEVDKAGVDKAGVDDADVATGQLAVYVGVDGAFAGTLIMSDPLRQNARDTLAVLRRLGVSESLMLTGDAQGTAEHIAAEAGITRVQAECLPADKVNAVASLPHRPVMMVGDGVNDAPVLAAADVGVAMGAKGSTAASESADVVIMLDDLSKVALAVIIGQRTLRVAVQSIWIGILLSIGLMVMAAVGYIPAIAGALSQELVDLAAILNALRALTPGRVPEARGQLRSGAPAAVPSRLG